MNDEMSTPSPDGASSPNQFERDMPETHQRDRAEAAIEELRQRGGIFVDAARATRMAMALTDPTLPGNPIVFANESFLNLSGYRMDEVLGQQPFSMNGPDTDPRDAERFRRILESDRDGVVETVQYAKNGRRFVATVLFSAFKDEDGKTLHHFLSWADVTRRVDAEDEADDLRQTQEALRESEEKYRKLFKTMGQGYCELELIRDDQGRAVDQLYLELNPAFERLFGIAAAKAKGRKASEVFPFVDALWHRMFDEVATTGEYKRFEHRHGPLNPWFEVFAYPAGGDRVVVLYDEITDRKRAEEALRQSEERQAFLLKLSDALQPIADPAEIQSVTAQMVGQHLGVDRSMYAEVNGPPGAETGIIRGQYVRPCAESTDSVRRFPARFEFQPFGAHTMAARYRGEPLVVADIATEPGFSEVERAAWLAAQVRAAVVIPLAKDGRLVAEFGVHCATAREWTDSDVSLLREVAERTWDAAERARAESKLRDSEERYRTLFESMDEAYAVVEVLKDEAGQWSDFKFIEVNPAFVEHTNMPDPAGKTATELLGTPNPSWARLYGEALETGKPLQVEESEPALGRTFDLNIFSLDQEKNRVAVLFTDVTERKTAEQALRDSEQRLRLIVQNARDYAIFTTDPTGIVTDWHEGAQSVFGFAREEIVGRDGDILFTPEDRDHGEPDKERLLAATEGKADNIRWHVRKGGDRVFIEGVSTALRNTDGSLSGFLKIGRDATQRHAVEQRQKLLLAELQHRVRNIMAMLRSIVRRTSVGKDDLEDFVQHLQGRIDAMARTQALLTSSVGRPVELEHLVRDEMLAQSAADGKFALFGPPARVWPQAAEVLTLALHELATNSVKYGALGQKDGHITITWACEGAPDDQRLHLTWHETGLTNRSARQPGFGTELITQRVPYELKGKAELTFCETALTATIDFPLKPGSSILETDPNPWIGSSNGPNSTA